MSKRIGLVKRVWSGTQRSFESEGCREFFFLEVKHSVAVETNQDEQ